MGYRGAYKKLVLHVFVSTSASEKRAAHRGGGGWLGCHSCMQRLEKTVARPGTFPSPQCSEGLLAVSDVQLVEGGGAGLAVVQRRFLSWPLTAECLHVYVARVHGAYTCHDGGRVEEPLSLFLGSGSWASYAVGPRVVRVLLYGAPLVLFVRPARWVQQDAGSAKEAESEVSDESYEDVEDVLGLKPSKLPLGSFSDEGRNPNELSEADEADLQVTT